jgi:hypothetical protein
VEDGFPGARHWRTELMRASGISSRWALIYQHAPSTGDAEPVERMTQLENATMINRSEAFFCQELLAGMGLAPLAGCGAGA